MKKFLFLGDFFYDYDYIKDDIEELASYVQENDLEVILNLEGTYKDEKDRYTKIIMLDQSKKVIDALQKLNVTAVNIANNHMMDWGRESLKELINDLDRANIPHFGAGTNLNKALNSHIIEYEDLKIGFLGFAWLSDPLSYARKERAGVAPLKRRYVLKKVEELNKKVDRLVLSAHWGYEYERYPLPIHRKLAHDCIDRGVDLVIGHHPHIIQVKEKYKEKPIYYSLGNFYFGSRRSKFYDYPKDRTNSSRYGLGVEWDPYSESTSEMLVDSTPNRTKFKDEKSIKDINEIPLDRYNQFFKKNRTSKNIKPNLMNDQPVQNIFKLKIENSKEIIFNIILSLISAIGGHSFLSKLMKDN